MATLKIGDREVTVTNLDKLWWPEEGITKGDVINYYIEIAPWLLPHLQGRPLVLTRYPEGWLGKSFYQKNTPQHAPSWLKTYPVESDKGRVINYCLVDDVASLIWVVNSGAFEIHPFLSRADNLLHPTYMVLDLDPMEKATWEDICQTAIAVGKGLELWGLKGFPKLSGSTGIQIFVPVRPVYTYEQIRLVAKALCQAVHSVLPEITTMERTIAKREGKLYLDYLQNAFGQTLATVYGVRPKGGAPVSTPVTWAEIEGMQVRPQDFTILTIKDRLQIHGDLFKPVLQLEQSMDHLLVDLEEQEVATKWRRL
ncbi:MAG: DNA polymerase domain-containing protein [Firmicutes bacterium]|nr:DNA polymerase domain-containing protein [Bacillota bacterium]